MGREAGRIGLKGEFNSLALPRHSWRETDICFRDIYQTISRASVYEKDDTL